MTRFIWLLCKPNSPSLWVTWVKRNLLHKSQFWVAKVPWSCSWTWRKILKIRDKVKPLISTKIGNGCHTSLWFDAWLPRGPICNSLNDRVIYDSGLPKDALVKDIIVNGQWRWPGANSPDLIDLKRETNDLEPPSGSIDEIRWNNANIPKFSSKVAWAALREQHPKVEWYPVVWFKYHIPRHSFFLWLAIKGRLSTQDKLLSYGLMQNMKCVFCPEQREDHDHLFFQCGFTGRVWKAVIDKCGIPFSSFSWSDTKTWMIYNFKGKSLRSLLGKLSLAAVVYALWRERNKRLYENSCLNELAIIKMVNEVVRLRILGSGCFPNTPENKHLIQVWELTEDILTH